MKFSLGMLWSKIVTAYKTVGWVKWVTAGVVTAAVGTAVAVPVIVLDKAAESKARPDRHDSVQESVLDSGFEGSWEDSESSEDRFEGVIYQGYKIENESIYHYDEDGRKTKDRVVDGYYFGNDGRLQADEEFVLIGENTYYLQENTVTYQYEAIEGGLYYFGNDGVRRESCDHDGYEFDSEGRLQADNVFVTVRNETYYLRNNVVVYNYMLLNEHVYYFGDDGVRRENCEDDGKTFDEEGRLSSNVFITIENVTYYVKNTLIVYDYEVIDGSIYYFGRDGARREHAIVGSFYFGVDGRLEGNNLFVTVKNKTYYVQNNIVVYNYKIINGSVYYFGDDGVRREDCDHDGYHFDMSGRLQGSNIFITIENKTYYIQNSVIVYNYLVIGGSIYYFGDDGVRRENCDHGGYHFNEDGKLEGNNVFITIENKTYYIQNNVIVYNYQIINGHIYYFGNNGVRRENCTHDGYDFNHEGKLRGHNIFITIVNKTYYIQNNMIVYNYQIINGHVYYFGTDGVMITDRYYGGYYFGSDGYILAEGPLSIIINGYEYWIIDNVVEMPCSLSGQIYESDNDENISNNTKLSNVHCTAFVNGTTYSCYSDSNGSFTFQDIESGMVELTFSRSGYITATATIDLHSAYSMTVVMDKQVSNTLSGKITIADTDMDYSNNVGLGNATVTITRTTSTNTFTKTTTTSSSGNYSFSGLTAGVYKLTVERTGYITVNQTVTVRYNETTIQNVAIEAISNTQVNNGYASGYVKDARTGNGIYGITVVIRSGLGNTTGTVLMEVKTDSSGFYKTLALKPGNYTAQIVDRRTLQDEEQRYGTVTIAIKIMSDTTIANQNAVTSNSVNIRADSMRIVLTWGASPSDLDSHLYADLTSGSDYHVYFNNDRSNYANLDVDDTSSYGPETVTIESLKDGTYKYYVHDYTNRSNSSNRQLANSGATVKVYIGSAAAPAYTFYVPAGTGTTWHVFTYNATSGEFTVVNTLSNYNVLN